MGARTFRPRGLGDDPMSGSGEYTTTPNLGLFKPTYNADAEQWGNHLNSNSDTIDAALGTIGSGGPFLPLNAAIPERTLFNGIVAAHVSNLNAAMARATAGAPALVGIIGDSTSVASSSSSASEGQTEHLRQALAEQFGAGAYVSIFNFGIGGQTWTSLDGI